MVTSTDSKIIYQGNSTTTIFAVPFMFLEDEHLVVVKTQNASGTQTSLTLGTHYGVFGAQEETGGYIEMVSPPSTGESLTIVRVVPATQLVDYIANDNFPAETHEGALDKLTMLAQQTAEELQRTLVFPANETPTYRTMKLADRSKRVLGFDANGILKFYTPDVYSGDFPTFDDVYTKEEVDDLVAKEILVQTPTEFTDAIGNVETQPQGFFRIYIDKRIPVLDTVKRVPLNCTVEFKPTAGFDYAPVQDGGQYIDTIESIALPVAGTTIGDYYILTTTAASWAPGDRAVWNGTTWDRIRYQNWIPAWKLDSFDTSALIKGDWFTIWGAGIGAGQTWEDGDYAYWNGTDWATKESKKLLVLPRIVAGSQQQIFWNPIIENRSPGDKALHEVYPEWWGARAATIETVIYDDSVALQNATQGGMSCRLQGGEYNVSRTMLWWQRKIVGEHTTGNTSIKASIVDPARNYDWWSDVKNRYRVDHTLFPVTTTSMGNGDFTKGSKTVTGTGDFLAAGLTDGDRIFMTADYQRQISQVTPTSFQLDYVWAETSSTREIHRIDSGGTVPMILFGGYHPREWANSFNSDFRHFGVTANGANVVDQAGRHQPISCFFTQGNVGEGTMFERLRIDDFNALGVGCAQGTASIGFRIRQPWISAQDDVLLSGKVDLIVGTTLVSGDLVEGDAYEITSTAGGADWTNLGSVTGLVGEIFVAVPEADGSLTPTSWGTGSLGRLDRVTQNGANATRFTSELAVGDWIDIGAGVSPPQQVTNIIDDQNLDIAQSPETKVTDATIERKFYEGIGVLTTEGELQSIADGTITGNGRHKIYVKGGCRLSALHLESGESGVYVDDEGNRNSYVFDNLDGIFCNTVEFSETTQSSRVVCMGITNKQPNNPNPDHCIVDRETGRESGTSDSHNSVAFYARNRENSGGSTGIKHEILTNESTLKAGPSISRVAGVPGSDVPTRWSNVATAAKGLSDVAHYIENNYMEAGRGHFGGGLAFSGLDTLQNYQKFAEINPFQEGIDTDVTGLAFWAHPSGNHDDPLALMHRMGGNQGFRYYDRDLRVCDTGTPFGTGNVTQDKFYRITDVSGGADFTAVGAPENIVGVIFMAVSTVEPTWGTGMLALMDNDETVDGAYVRLRPDVRGVDGGTELRLQNTNAGGTTTRIHLDGTNVIMPTLPTSDPAVSGALWNNAGVINISP